MRRGYLIYEPEEAEKNEGFIQWFQTCALPFEIEISYLSSKAYQDGADADFVWNRTRDFRVSQWFENRKIEVYHSSGIVKIANDKCETLRYLQEQLPDQIKKKKWCPESKFLSADQVNAYLDEKKQFPSGMVIKSLDGHGGNEVFLTGEDMEKQNVLRDRNCLLQEKIDSRGRDLRVYVVWGKIYQAVLRSGKKDFRSNYSLGGEVQAYPLSADQKEYISYFIDAFSKMGTLAMAGIDFLLTSDETLIFNELEEMVGSRMLYRCTDKDIIRDSVKKMTCLKK